MRREGPERLDLPGPFLMFSIQGSQGVAWLYETVPPLKSGKSCLSTKCYARCPSRFTYCHFFWVLHELLSIPCYMCLEREGSVIMLSSDVRWSAPPTRGCLLKAEGCRGAGWTLWLSCACAAKLLPSGNSLPTNGGDVSTGGPEEPRRRRCPRPPRRL